MKPKLVTRRPFLAFAKPMARVSLLAVVAAVGVPGCGGPANVVPDNELTEQDKEAIKLEDNAVDMAEGN